MIFTSEEKEIIQSHFKSYDGHINDEADCKLFMFNLEQHLAFKNLEKKLDSAENQVFYVLLSNNSIENSYPNELTKLFQVILELK